MTAGEIATINEKRLRGWQNMMNEHHSTAAILIGMGHDQVSGEIHICIPENMSREYVEGLLAKVGEILRGGKT